MKSLPQELIEKINRLVHDKYDELHHRHGWRRSRKLWKEKIGSLGIDVVSPSRSDDQRIADLNSGRISGFVKEDFLVMLDPSEFDYTVMVMPNETAARIAVMRGLP